MPKLNIPYRSQWDNDAGDHDTDCGPTSLAMILNYFDVAVTPDRVYDHPELQNKGKREFTGFRELILVARSKGLKSKYFKSIHRVAAFNELRANIDAGVPMLALVNYNSAWNRATGNNYLGGHFVVITGYDDANVYIHDPLFGLVAGRSGGAHFAMSHDLFNGGWSGFNPQDNPNWAYITVKKEGVAAVVQPKPVVEQKPVVKPPVQTAVSTPSTPLTDDIERRIRALAAYRWTEGPDFTNAADVKLWQDHLGDFAAQYDKYVVKPGNSLSLLASQFYDGQHRWPVIKAFNNLQREGLWAGETLKIPHIGQSGAGQDPALPSNTLDKAKAFSMDDLVDPDAAAMDYNDFGSKSVGIGFYEESES